MKFPWAKSGSQSTDLMLVERNLAEKYQETFLRDERTRDVFEDLLTDLKLYETIDSEEERILYNFGIRLLAKMGLVREVTSGLTKISLATPTPVDSMESSPRDMRR